MDEQLFRESSELARQVCDEDSVTLIEEALSSASRYGSTVDTKSLLNQCLYKAVQERSLVVLSYLLSHGADVYTITPEDIGMDCFDDWEDPELSLPPIELLDILLAFGWDINSMGSPQDNMCPLLWYVCGSIEHVQWCLDHGANVTIPGEKTSVDPNDSTADIYHTLRHPLLLETVAVVGNVATFELLRARGAPLTPGNTWPPWHNPCLLMQAVQQAFDLASTVDSCPTLAYTERVSMVRYLLYTIGISANESSPHSHASSIVRPNFLIPNYNHRRHELQSENFQELADILLNAGAICKSISYLEAVGLGDEQSTYAPLEYLQRKALVWQRQALKDWYHSRSSTVYSESISGPPKEQISDCHAPPIPGSGQLIRLPVEIIGLIASQLNFQDLRSFRQASRATLEGSIQAFKTLISRRHLPLTIKAIETFQEQLELEHHPARCVEELMISQEGLLSYPQFVELQALFTRCFLTARAKGSLRTLILQQGEYVLVLLLSFLQESRLPLAKLGLFPDDAEHSATIDKYRMLPNISGLSATFSTLYHFRWAITVDRPTSQSNPSLNIAIVNQILSMMPKLRTLELWWYAISPATPENFVIDHCLDPVLAMDRLEKLSLQGFYVSESTLCAMLSRTTAIRIILQDIILSLGGQMGSILDILTSGRFQYFYLQDLRENYCGKDTLIYFDSASIPEFSIYSNKITREGNETRRKLKYGFTKRKSRKWISW